MRSCRRWRRSFHGQHCVPRLSHKTPSRGEVVRRWDWDECCGCTSCSTGSTWPMKRARKLCWTVRHCDVLWESTWARAGSGWDDAAEVSSFAGKTRAGGGTARAGQSNTAGARSEGRQGNGRRRDNYWCAELNGERNQGPRSRHASDPQGSAVILRHEDAHRRGQSCRLGT